MADIVSDGKGPEANAKVPKKGMLTGKNKWYVVGALAAIAVLVFVFVKKSNSTAAASTTSGSTDTSGTTDSATDAALESSLAAQGSSMGDPGAAGATGATGAAGSAGAKGATGAAGKAGTSGQNGKAGTAGKTGSSGGGLPSTQYYTVKSGDTLSSIAAKFKIKGGYQTLYNDNRGAIGSNPNLIHPGLRLKL